MVVSPYLSGPMAPIWYDALTLDFRYRHDTLMTDQSNSQSATSGLKRQSMLPAATLVDLLGPWADGADPLNEQLASALARAIDLGVLPPGTRMPAERELARELALSRTTIVAAYDRL